MTCTPGTNFPNASTMESFAINNTIIWQEISEIQKSILLASSQCQVGGGRFSTTVSGNTPMTFVTGLSSVDVVNGGSGYYIDRPTVQFVSPLQGGLPGPGAGATGTVVVNENTGAITNIIINSGGTNYQPIHTTLSVSSSGGTNASIQPLIDPSGGIYDTYIGAAGSNYAVGDKIIAKRPRITEFSDSWKLSIFNGPTPGPYGLDWVAITYGNGKFVAVTNQSQDYFVVTSTDGVVWTLGSLSYRPWKAMGFGNGIFVVFAGFGLNNIATSTDGINWTERLLPVSADWRSVAYGNGIFVAIGLNSNIAVTSPDGITWTQRTLPVSAIWRSITYGNGKFVAVASNSNIAATSSDGITWTQQILPTTTVWLAVAYGNGAFIAVSYGTTIAATSYDGIHWTQRILPVPSRWVYITYGAGVFLVIASGSNTALTTTDGINWTQRVLPETSYWIAAAYGGDKFVVSTEYESKVAYTDDTTAAKLRVSGINGSGGITKVDIDFPGSNYFPSETTLKILNSSSPPIPYPLGTGFDATVNGEGFSGAITSVNILNTGSGYFNIDPFLVTSGPGFGAVAKTTLNGSSVSTVNIIEKGNGYTTNSIGQIVNPIQFASPTTPATIILHAYENTYGTSPTLYWETWSGVTTNRPISAQLNAVLSYFTNLGYTIAIKSNPATGNTILWQISW